jgi:DNA-binding PadR family transcriptional regulator
MPRADRSRFVLLGLLATQPMTGYDLKRFIDQSIAHIWSESFGQIYPVLHRLAAAGLIRRTGKAGSPRRRVVYTITPAGRRTLREWLRTPTEPSRPRQEVLLKMFFSSELPAPERRAIVEAYRAERRALLEQYHAIAESLAPIVEAEPLVALPRLTLRFGVLVNEAALAWCEEALAELDRVALLERSAT